ncbi:MAG TPA: hypothetical protein VFF04_02240 [Candidatus Babeliales bacterium]|nr:hypothetical protein [Candidatus Babeliales bacterium]
MKISILLALLCISVMSTAKELANYSGKNVYISLFDSQNNTVMMPTYIADQDVTDLPPLQDDTAYRFVVSYMRYHPEYPSTAGATEVQTTITAQAAIEGYYINDDLNIEEYEEESE